MLLFQPNRSTNFVTDFTRLYQGALIISIIVRCRNKSCLIFSCRLRAIPLFIVSRTKTERAGKWQKGAETRGKIEGLPL